MLRILFLIPLAHLCLNGMGQDSAYVTADSSKILKEVTIRAYEYGRSLNEVPASVGLIGQKDFERFSPVSLVPAINTIPGVRMEERSPGSYRISVRGSTLRSPFGIRNVKVYWNDLPFTDPGGNTYLNLIDLTAVQNIEIIKGPGSSLYGAGTGGVMLLKSYKPEFNRKQLQFSSSGGSYGMFRYTLGAQSSSEKVNTNVQFAHQQSAGYREQSKMERNAVQVQGNFNVDNNRIISVNLVYAHLNYETPGGLTKDQYEANPKQARPSGTLPGAVDQQAAIDNKTFYTGLSQEYIFNTRWSNRTGVYGTFTQFENPAIRNYERRTEQSLGGRSVTQYNSEKFKFNFGGEFQVGFSPIKTYTNNYGNAGVQLTDDEITSNTSFLFAQTEIVMPYNFYLTLGGSINFSTTKFIRLSVDPNVREERNFTPVMSPRLALLKKINSSLSIYGSVSQGFSPPTVAEIYPSSSVFDKTLEAEKGNNIEAGVHASILNNILNLDITTYTFQLRNAITLRRTDNGGEYFINAGSTSQKGIELSLAWTPNLRSSSLLNNFKLWTSSTLSDYKFTNYDKDTLDLSGNKLTGVAPIVLLAGLDFTIWKRLYGNFTFNYIDRIPLDDSNTEFANPYNLLSGRAGYRTQTQKLVLDFFAGIDNALDAQYSLGNDLNADRQRFYNAAARRNFYVGLKINFVKRVNR